MMTERWFWISLHYATFGECIVGGIVTDAAPLARWAVGKPARVLTYYRQRGAEIVEIV